MEEKVMRLKRILSNNPLEVLELQVLVDELLSSTPQNWEDRLKESILRSFQLIDMNWVREDTFTRMIDLTEELSSTKFNQSSKIRLLAKATLMVMG